MRLKASHAAVAVLAVGAAVLTIVLASGVLTDAPAKTACSVVTHAGAGLGRKIRAARPGDTICLRTGDYDVRRLVIRTSGAPGARITLRGANPDRPATLHGVI